MLGELQQRGHHVVEEPGRRIVADQHASGGDALPWVNLAAFAEKAIALAHEDRRIAATQSGLVFFDRGLVDAACALEFATGLATLSSVSAQRYHRLVFLTPPWQEIYVTDSERPHSFADAVGEYDRLVLAFTRLSYECVILPKASISDRADFVLSRVLDSLRW